MKSFRLPLLIRTLSLPAVTLLAPLSVWADTTISSDFTQNGGTFTVSPPTLLVTHESNDPTLTLTNGAAASWVGATIVGNLNGESGNMEVLNGSSVFNDAPLSGVTIGSYGSITVLRGEAHIGLNTGASGTALISGNGSQWEVKNTFNVGTSGTGSVVVSDGGSVISTATIIGRNNGSQGEATVTGAGSQWTINGNYGENLSVGLFNGSKGELTIADGGSVTATNGSVRIGSGVGSQGKVTVSGTNSQWNVSSDVPADLFSVGHSGMGELIIMEGGRVAVAGGTSAIGYDAGSGSVTVTGEGSTWEAGSSLSIGVYFSSTNNTLTIEDSALVKAGNLSFGNGGNNHLRLDGGYIALFGDKTTTVGNFITAGRIQLWDGSAWTTATAEDVVLTYYANDAGGEAAALAATGYSGLGGYTVATVQAVPEPSTATLLLLGAGALAFRLRRRPHGE